MSGGPGQGAWRQGGWALGLLGERSGAPVCLSVGGMMEAAVPVGGPPGLPRAFLHSLRTLFDILDDQRRGIVHIQEIESRWRGADTRELPPGVLLCLRRVAPPDGYLTFERFVLGLRSSMLNSQNRENCQLGAPRTVTRPPGAKPGHSKPQPLGVRFINGTRPGIVPPTGEGSACREERPHTEARRMCPTRSKNYPAARKPSCATAGAADAQTHSSLTKIIDGPNIAGEEAKPTMCRSQSESNSQGMTDQCRHQRSRGEHRRHTITNGVDYGVLKRMKELEHEKDLLLQGLEMVERARDWYLQQIHSVQEQQRSLGKTELFIDSGVQNPLLPKLQEVNRCLGDLLAPCRTGVPSPSVTSATAATTGNQQAVNMLKEQNRLLTKEVTDKSDRITQLEQEKSALIKQLFEARARSNADTSAMDSTFI